MKRNAIVTGGVAGLGLEFVKLLLKDNYHVIVVDKDNVDEASFKKDQLRGIEGELTFIQKDLARSSSAMELYNEFRHLEIDVLINNAGFGLFGKFNSTDWGKEEAMINLHVLTTTHLTKLFLKDMLERDQGMILNMASLAGFQPGPLMSIYYATKAYILHFTEAIANEAKGTNVKVSVLCPGQTKTNFQQTVSENTSENKIGFNVGCPVEVAAYGYKKLKKGRVVIIPGAFNKFLASLSRFMTRGATTSLVRKIQESNRDDDGSAMGTETRLQEIKKAG